MLDSSLRSVALCLCLSWQWLVFFLTVRKTWTCEPGWVRVQGKLAPSSEVCYTVVTMISCTQHSLDFVHQVCVSRMSFMKYPLEEVHLSVFAWMSPGHIHSWSLPVKVRTPVSQCVSSHTSMCVCVCVRACVCVLCVCVCVCVCVTMKRKYHSNGKHDIWHLWVWCTKIKIK